MKRILTLSLALVLLCALLCGTVFAQETYIIDDAHLLTQSEREELNDLAEQISRQYACSVLVLTVDSLDDYYDAGTYAEDYFDQNRLGYNGTDDGILLLLSIGERDYAVTAAGVGENAVYGSRMSELEDAFLGYLGNNDWYRGFKAYLNKCGDLLAHKDDPVPVDPGYDYDYYDYSYRPTRRSEPGKVVFGVILALVAGFLLSLIPLGVMKSKINNVKQNAAAANYVRDGSMQLYVQRDDYLRTNTTRVRIQNDPPRTGGGGGGSHFSSGGVSHTTSSGKF